MKNLFIFFYFFTSVSFSQIITTIAGNGVGTYAGDGGQATSASFSEPQGVVIDDTGNVYVVDEDDDVIRKINTSGIIHTIIGTGSVGYSGDGGQAKLAKLNSPGGAVIDRKGNIYITDTYNHVIRKVNTSGIISTIAGHGTISGYGGDGGAATNAYLNFPEMITVDGIGNIYVTDAGNNRVRKIDTAGIIKTIAGTGVAAYAGDGGAATSAKLAYPTGIALDTTSEIIYIGDANNNAVRKIDAAGIITTFAGTGVVGYSGNGGLAMVAKLHSPQGVAIDTAGTIYISDGGNNVIRKVTTAGIISTYVGTGVAGYGGDGGPAVLAKIYNPPGITVDVTGNLYIAEYFNSRVRKVTFCSSPLNLNVSGTFSVCVGDSTQLTASGALTYTWSVNVHTANINIVYVKPTTSSTYSVVGVSGGCAAIDSVAITVDSCALGVKVNHTEPVFIYPNPTNGILNIKSNIVSNAQLEIYNAIGEKIFFNLVRDAETQINLSDIKAGIYFLRIVDGNNIIYQSTLIKQ
jgi:sugar lactone lactonase YvrE